MYIIGQCVVQAMKLQLEKVTYMPSNIFLLQTKKKHGIYQQAIDIAIQFVKLLITYVTIRCY